MDDSISRKAAIDLYKRDYDGRYAITNAEQFEAMLTRVPSAQPQDVEKDIRAMCGECDAWNVYKNYPPEPRWIPCSERLPDDVEIGEEYPEVIFCTKDVVYVGFYEYLGGKWWAAEDFSVDGVIAWMPRPKPYERRQE